MALPSSRLLLPFPLVSDVPYHETTKVYRRCAPSRGEVGLMVGVVTRCVVMVWGVGIGDVVVAVNNHLVK